RLAGAGCAYQCSGRTWRHVKGNFPQRRQSLHVAEAHVLIANVSKNSSFLRWTVISVGEAVTFAYRGYKRSACQWFIEMNIRCHKTRFGLFVENFKYALACRASSLNKLIELMQSAQRIIEKRD